MDAFDLKILDALQVDGRLSNQELAERVGLSASQCSRRRSALESDGAIEGYHASLSAKALGLDVLAFVQIRLAAHSPRNSMRFKELIESLPEVQEAYSLTGEFGLSGEALGVELDRAVTHPQRSVSAA